MARLTPDDLFSLEEYARKRPEFRQRIIEHKRHRRIALGDHAALYFEDALTMQYQVQEMLRIEKIFEPDGIRDELDAYNPLIPDGSNWKATFMVEYQDVGERKAALARLIGIERALWVRIGDGEKVRPIANEDLDRETEEKTSAVHFVRFELTPAMCAAVRDGAAVSMGIDHPNYHVETSLSDASREALAADLA